MPLTPGTRLGPYEITGAIGAGGMGEVFRARDTKLNRDVAIKVLPAAFANDPERLTRFTREAQTLASLNHPNIATIHGIEELSTDNGSAASRALVMELVDGEDLSALMARGPMPVAEALPIARQIAEALEAAHEQGIVHRDLKPANIKVRNDGTVKVLDFGLAKAMDPAGASSSNPSLSHSPTLTHQGTSAGMIIGTAAYMSPEQAKGKSVDKRADIWAFGVVLYEMLSGERAFKGEDVSETLASVLKDALPMNRLPPGTPPRLRQLIERCVERDLKNRLRDIGEARFEISKVESRAPDISSVGAAAPRSSRDSRPPRPAFAVVSLVALALAVPAVRHLREAPHVDAPEMRLDIDIPGGPRVWDFALSPDGLSIAFAATGDPGKIWIRRLNQTAAQPLAGTENGRGAFWSPDSKSIGFWSEGKLKRLDLAGGTPTTLCDGDMGGTWGKDGVVVFRTPAGVQRVSATGGQPSAVFPNRNDIQRAPYFLPDGRRFLFVGGATGSRGTVYLASLDGGEPKALFAGAGAQWLPPDWIVYLDQDKLLARRLSLVTSEPVGEPELIASVQGFVSNSGGGAAGLFSTSSAGILAYRINGIPTIEMSWHDRRGQPAGARTEVKGFVNAQEVSPDGLRVAVDVNADGNRDIWLRDEKLGSSTRFTFDPEADGFPVWSPDGRSIAFESNRKGNFDIYLKPASGSTPEQPLFEAPGQQWPVDFSRDGRFLLYYDQVNSGDLMALPLTEAGKADRRPIAVAATPATENLGAISPDSRWVAYQTSESGRTEVVVQAFPAAGGKWQISTDGGSSPRWSADGRELFFISGGMLMASAVRASGDSFAAGPAVRLFPLSVSGVPLRQRYAVSRDGRFLTTVENDTATTPVTIVLNWKPGAK